MADDILNDPRVSIGGAGAPASGPVIDVGKPKETTLQSLPSDAGTGGAAAAPTGASTGADEAPSPPSPGATADAEQTTGSGGELYPGATPFAVAGAPDEHKDLYPGATTLHPDASSALGTFGQQASASAVEGTAAVGGMVAGAAIGTLGGPFAPITVPVGAAIGFGAGVLAGGGYRNLLSVPRVEDLPDNLRSWGYGGEFFGGAIPLAGAPLTAARTGFRFASSRVGNFLNKMLDYAAERPATFASAELSGATGGMAGTMEAEAHLPGNTPARVAFGIAGGFLNPLRLLTQTLRPAWGLMSKVVPAMTESARQTQAGKILKEAIELSGEDFAVLAQILRESGHPSIGGLTAAQKSGSHALAAIEAQLAFKNPGFREEADKQATAAFEAIRHAIELLISTGDPAALRTVAALRKTYFQGLLAGLVTDAKNKALQSAAAVTKDTPAARIELSKEISAAVEAAMKQARHAEKYLWDQVPQNTPAAADNILAALAEIKATRLLTRFGETLPEVLERIETAMTNPLKSGNQRAMTSGELTLLRSRMLELAKSSAAKNDFSEASIYGRVAEAALEDLGAISGSVKDKVDAARSFSREFHDTFTRTFAGDTAAVNAKGADRIPIELVAQRALGSGAEGGDLRLSQLADATDFMAKKGWAEGAPEELFGAIGTIRSSVDRLVRLAASDAVDPLTGRISAGRLAQFISGHDALLNRFPEVRKALDAAISDATKLADLEAVAANARPILKTKTAFAKLLGVDSPGMAITKAASGPNPQTDLLAMAKLARRGGQSAVDGMSAAAWDHAFTQATATDGLSFPHLRAAFFGPMAPGVPSLMETLVKGGVVPQAEARAVEKLLDAADKIDVAGAGRAAGSQGEFDPLMTAVVRTVGSQAGGFIAKHTLGTSTLIANSAGAKYLLGVLSKLNVKGVQDVLMQASRDPKMMAALLTRAKSEAEGMKFARQLHAYALSAGLLWLESQEHLDDPIQPDEPQRFQKQQKEGGQQNDITGQASVRDVNGGASQHDYPADEDVKAALDAGVDYGTGFETALREGKVVDATGVKGDMDAIFKRLSKGKAKPDPRVVNVLTRALLASRRDPITALGFNPNKIAIEKSGAHFNVGGVYDPETDIVLSMGDTPSNIAHESTHRGLQQLLASGKLTDEEKKFVNAGMNNEMIVRYIMATKMGDVEGTHGSISKNQRDMALARFKYLPDYQKMLKAITDKAAKLVAERKPGGPA